MARFTNRGNIEIRFFSALETYPTFDPEEVATTQTIRFGILQNQAENIQHGSGSEGECIADMGGWELSQSEIAVPDICSNVTGNIPGEITTGSAYLEYYDDDVSTPSRDLLQTGLRGWVTIVPQGIEVGNKGDWWPVRVQANRNLLNIGNEAARFRIDFTTSQPVEFEIIPNA